MALATITKGNEWKVHLDDPTSTFKKPIKTATTGNTYVPTMVMATGTATGTETATSTAFTGTGDLNDLEGVLAERYLYQSMDSKTVKSITNDIQNYIGGLYQGVRLRNNVCFDTGTDCALRINIENNSTNVNWYNIGNGNDYFTWNAMIEDFYPQATPLGRIRRQLSPAIHVRGATPTVDSPEEAVAQEALREVVTEAEFRKYLRYGFVLVEGRSGATYQVFRNRHHVRVWVGGKLVEEICVYLSSAYGSKPPPTDKVVAFKAMIEADEEAFKNMGNRYRNLGVAA